MTSHCAHLSYQDTNRFSGIVIDYLEDKDKLSPFFTHKPNAEGIKAAINSRRSKPVDRKLLHDYFKKRYSGSTTSVEQLASIDALLKDNCFTITTAHQPNIFSGPLYFLYKIIHVIKLAEYLSATEEGHHFVPVFYMGSEDADLDELGHCYAGEDKLVWHTDQQGAVGRMHTKGLDKIIQSFEQRLYNKPFIEEILGVFREAYSEENNIQEATFSFVNALFARFGLLVVMPDDANLKKSFEPWILKELLEGFSQQEVKRTNDALEALGYTPQVSGRDINLFYLDDTGRRERIEKDESGFSIAALGKTFTTKEIVEEVKQHPERFSGNVVLRGLFQEHILPNVAFIGGGGEIAYWLQLKTVFEAAGISFPVLMLRNSFLLMDSKAIALQEKLSLSREEIFYPLLKLKDLVAEKHNDAQIPQTKAWENEISKLYQEVLNASTSFDASLYGHIAAMQTDALKQLRKLEKKFKRLARRKAADQLNQLSHLFSLIFPLGGLQERTQNMIPWYAEVGKELIDTLYANATPFNEDFGIIYFPNASVS